MLAFIVIVLFFLGMKFHSFHDENRVWIISGLMSMACLDIFHAVSPIGNYFVWFHSFAVFSGGCLFFGVLFPPHWPRLARFVNLFFVITISITSIYTLLPGDNVPTMVQGNQFTALARILNLTGGLGFLMAFAHFLYQYLQKHKNEDKVLALHCLFFSMGGLLFEYSSLWDLSWWWWHGLRLVAYSLLFYFIYAYYLSLQRDVLKKKIEAEAKYKLLYDKFEFATNEAGIGIWEWEINTNTLLWNKVMHEIYEIPSDTPLSYTDWQSALSETDAQHAEHELNMALQSNRQFDSSFDIITPSGQKRHIKAVGKKYRNDNFNRQSFIGINIDITAQKDAEQKLIHYAQNDEVTGLFNRKYFLSLLDKALIKAKKHNTLLSIMFIDLDNFKKINDTYGHQRGDEVLKATSAILINSVKYNKIVARVGGDEFVILLQSLKSRDNAGDLASTLISTLNKKISLQNHDGEAICSFSIGISVYPSDASNAKQLLINADLAMYKAKESGKNQYHYFTDSLQTAYQEKLKLKQALWQAIEKQEFFLLYQPYVNLDSNQVEGVEALLRWQSPTFNRIIEPKTFIPIAEKNGLIQQIDTWVLKQATQDWAWLKRQKTSPIFQKGDITLSINLSANELSNIAIIEQIKKNLNENQILPHALNIELTETAFIENKQRASKIFHTLSSLNIQLTLDDFGTGYSSLSYLHQYPFNHIKLHNTFLKQLPHNQKIKNIFITILRLANELNINLIFEGIETKSQLTRLKSYLELVDKIKVCGQGFYIQKPVPLPGLLRYFLKN